jgi:hypothetical protein
MKTRLILIACLLAVALVVTSAVMAASFVFSGFIASGAQYDLYNIDLIAGENVRATLVCDEIAPGDRPLDPVLSVFLPGVDPGDVSDSAFYNDDGFGSDDFPEGVDCNAFDSSIVMFTAPVAGSYTFRADGFGSSTGPYTLTITTGGLISFVSGDERINQDAWAPVAIFCSSGGVNVMTVASSTLLTPLFSASAEDVTGAAAGATIASAGGVSLSKTGDGSLQVLAPQSDGKGYLYVWNGCPRTWSTTYTVDPVTGTTRATGTGGH